MFTDPFAAHASPVAGGQPSSWGLANIAKSGAGEGNGAMVADPIPSLGSTTTTHPAATPAPAYAGPGFGSLNQDFGMSQFQTDPGYQWRMDQGIQGLDRSAAARGLLMSGGQLKALDRYNQEFASNEYSNAFNRYNIQGTNRFNRLAALAGIGQASQAQLGQMGMNAANNISYNQLGAGNAAAAGYYASGQNTSNLVNGLGSAWLNYGNGGGGGGGWGGGGSLDTGGTGYSGASGTGMMW